MDSNPLLHRTMDQMPGVVDYRGRPAHRASSGRWAAALYIIVVEMAERFAFYGISSNLISYLTGPLGQPTAAAAAAVNAWSGMSSMLPLLGAFVADSYVGRYRTIVGASLLYILGLGMLALSSSLPFLHPQKCADAYCKPSTFQVAFFYISLYLVAFAEGGHKPCVQAFGADQFDENDPKESISRSSFFNWWYFGLCGGTVVTLIVLSYIQDNIGWGLGFGIPCFIMLFALVVFLLGTKTYRFYPLKDESPFVRIGNTIIALMTRKKQSTSPIDREAQIPRPDSDSFSSSSIKEGQTEATVINKEVHEEEAKRIFVLFPIWATCLIYAVVFSQSSTLFTKQASTLDKRIGSHLQLPPAALQSFISASIIIFMPIYDRVIVPTARKFTGLSSGITMLQRIGTGLVLSMLAMVIAASVEIKRLQTARDYDLVDQPKATIPMSLWWLVPQYVLFGVSDVFTMVGLQEFFYDQVPDSLRSLGIALYMSIFGIGNFISGFLISVIDKATGKNGDSWFNNNLNKAHLDYFYWLLAGLSALELALYVYFAKIYPYKKKENISVM